MDSDAPTPQLTDYAATLVAWLFGDQVPLDVLVQLHRYDRFGKRARRAGNPWRAGQVQWTAREALRLQFAHHIESLTFHERQRLVREVTVLATILDDERSCGVFELTDDDPLPLDAIDQTAFGLYRRLWAKGWSLAWVGLPDWPPMPKLPDANPPFHVGRGVIARGGSGRFRATEPPDASDLRALLPSDIQ